MGSVAPRLFLSVPVFFAALAAVSPGSLRAVETVSLGVAARHAVEMAKLTSSGSKPFHLKATIVETTNPDSDYQGDVEEYWVSPQKWRRVIHAPGFSQTLIVNGDRISETDSGDYYPFWLRELVTAIFDPLPMFAEKKLDQTKLDQTKLDEIKLLKAQIVKPAEAKQENSCARFESKAGIAPAQNTVLEVFCFEGDYSLPRAVVTPGYAAEFQHYKPFGKKWIARSITIDPEPETTIEAKVVELAELSKPDESLFSVEQPTVPEAQLKSVRVEEASLRKLGVKTPEIVWPAIQEGKTSGALSLYVSVDREGKVREAWPINSDNPGLDQAVCEQVRQWEFKRAIFDNVHVQVEGILTFAFETRIEQKAQTQPDADGHVQVEK